MNRLLSRVKRVNGCWIWTKGTTGFNGNYGNAYLGGKRYRAHRLAWMLFHGEIPDRMFVLHKCDNGLCINPDHLFLGTQKDNMTDCVRKGRSGFHLISGEANVHAKLTSGQVVEIRRLVGKMSGRAVAKIYGVARHTIYDIWQRKMWRYLKEERE